MSDWASRRLHFIGIGGAGMSGLALVSAELGAVVTGSDQGDSSYMERLRMAGLEPVLGHDAANLPVAAEVVVSTAIAADNPELALAEQRGQKIMHRSDLLAELCQGKRLIAVAGTHGKTTTTAMIVWALRGLGVRPAFVVGGEVPGLGPGGAAANAGWDAGEWIVVEADESDGSFLKLKPEIAVVTNVEMDHHSHWHSLEELVEAFRDFASTARAVALPDAAAFGAGAMRTLAEASDILNGEEAGMRRVVRFDADTPGPADLPLGVRGLHNLLNARAALGAIELADLDPGAAAAELGSFPGVGRRLEYKGLREGAEIYDDYAHHPTEVSAALEALGEKNKRRLIAVFQPHLYSRTKEFSEQFGEALALADEVVVLDVYPAREKPVGELAGISGRDVYEAARRHHPDSAKVHWTPTLEEAEAKAAQLLDEDTVLVTVGAGDVYRVGEALIGGGS